MRLIDADSITEKIMNVFEEALKTALKSGKYDLEGVMLKIKCYLDNQPTAFDVEKVVSELEEATKLYEYEPQMNYYKGISVGYERALEIVKRGGIDEQLRSICGVDEASYRQVTSKLKE